MADGREPLQVTGKIQCGDMVHVFGNMCYRIDVQMYGDDKESLALGKSFKINKNIPS